MSDGLARRPRLAVLASLVFVSHIEFRLWLGSSADIGSIHLVGQWFVKTPVAVHHKHYLLCLPAQANLHMSQTLRMVALLWATSLHDTQL